MTPAKYVNSELPTKAPTTKLELTWVYGYESQRSTNNIHFDHKGNAVYPAGKYVVAYDMDCRQQRIFGGHTDIVLCLAVTADGQTMASGDGEAGSTLLVWDASSHALQFRSSYHKGGVILVAFSANGKFVGSVGDGLIKRLLVSDWRVGESIYTSIIGLEICRSIAFFRMSPLRSVETIFWSNGGTGISNVLIV